MLTSLLITCIGFGYAFALSSSTVVYRGLPLLLICAGLSFGIKWLCFIPAYLKQSERYYDLTGSLTYLVMTLFALYGGGHQSPRGVLLACLVMIWALRLGRFLFKRVRQDGGDGRFDTIKPRFGAFLTAWTLQGLWVIFTASAAWVGMLSTEPTPLTLIDAFAIGLWVVGFSLEVTADHQKRRFREEQGSAKFIQEGVWR